MRVSVFHVAVNISHCDIKKSMQRLLVILLIIILDILLIQFSIYRNVFSITVNIASFYTFNFKSTFSVTFCCYHCFKEEKLDIADDELLLCQ